MRPRERPPRSSDRRRRGPRRASRGRRRPSAPWLEDGLVARTEDGVQARERRILVREISAKMAAATFPPHESASRDHAGDGMRRTRQSLEPDLVANETGLAPHRLAQLGGDRRSRRRGGRAGRPGGGGPPRGGPPGGAAAAKPGLWPPGWG